MRNKEFEYYLNAIHYCIWLHERNFDKWFYIVLNVIFSPFKYLLTRRIREKKYEKRRQKADN